MEKRTLKVLELISVVDGRYRYKVQNENGNCELATSWNRELKINTTSLFEVRKKDNYPINIKLIEDQKKVFNDNRGELSMIAQDLARISSRIKKLLNDTEQ